jgi:hypothetical protein
MESKIESLRRAIEVPLSTDRAFGFFTDHLALSALDASPSRTRRRPAHSRSRSSPIRRGGPACCSSIEISSATAAAPTSTARRLRRREGGHRFSIATLPSLAPGSARVTDHSSSGPHAPTPPQATRLCSSSFGEVSPEPWRRRTRADVPRCSLRQLPTVAAVDAEAPSRVADFLTSFGATQKMAPIREDLRRLKQCSKPARSPADWVTPTCLSDGPRDEPIQCGGTNGVSVSRVSCPIAMASLVRKNHCPLPVARPAARQSRTFNTILITATAISITSARALARFGPKSIPNTSRIISWMYDGGS